jgi:hypothetical protein
LLKIPPFIDTPHLDLTTDDQAEQQTLCCARVGQRTLGPDPEAKLPIEPLDGIGGAKRFPVALGKAVKSSATLLPLLPNSPPSWAPAFSTSG